MKADLVIKNARVYREGDLFDGGIAVKDGRIVSVSEDAFLPEASDTIDAKGMAVLPGVIDTHVHVRDPGHRERGTFASETRAAAAGGVTSFLEHPISSPPPYSPKILRRRIEVAKPQSMVDYAFFGAAGSEFPEEVLKVAREGIVAFKTFLHQAPEGREDEFRGLTMADDGGIMDGFQSVAKTGLILTIHAENNDMIKRLIAQFRAEGKTGFEYHAKSRPPITEIESVEKLIRFAKEYGTRISIAHTSTPEAMELIQQAKAEGQDIYCETCPHYLFLTEEKIKELGPYAKGNPPLRDHARMEALWKYINNGLVDYIGSDHGPFLVSEKDSGLEDIFKAAAGPAAIELTLPLMLTAVRDGKLTLKRMVELLSENAARIFRLIPEKNGLRVGSDADIVVVDLEHEFVVDNKDLVTQSRDTTPMYNGFRLIGKPIHTVVRGRVVMRDRIIDETAHGWGKCLKPDGAKRSAW